MTYVKTIQQALDYLEDTFLTEVSLDEIASFCGFSLYHFHRIFQKETGYSIGEYIRLRRLAHASTLLIYTDTRIIDIAMICLFESQAAFTRAFKNTYKMPPGKYRNFLTKLMETKGEMEMNEQAIKGWFLRGTHPHNYEAGVDREVVHQGSASAFIKSKAVQLDEEFATLMQEFKAEKYLGKRMKLSGFLKTENVNGWAGLWMRVDDKDEDILRFDNMGNRPVTGSTNWQHYSIVLHVPLNATVISFGFLLNGKGQVWTDDLRFEEVDLTVPETNIEMT